MRGLLIRRGMRWLALASLMTTVAVAAPASAATLSSGHVDVFDVDKSGSALTLSIKTPSDDDVDPGATTFEVPPAALTTVPSGSSYSCLGSAGSPVYVLPQSESAATSLGVLWAGWNTEGVPADGPASVTLRLDSAGSTIPAGGRFALYTTSLGTASFKLNTNGTATCTKTQFSVNRNAHGHGAWAFTEPGTYELKVRATGSGVTASPWQYYTFVVG